MKIALDYDGTYTRDPGFWQEVVKLAKERGHEIRIVTARYPNAGYPPLQVPEDLEVVWCSLEAKAKHYSPDVWIDDEPHWIFIDRSLAAAEALAAGYQDYEINVHQSIIPRDDLAIREVKDNGRDSSTSSCAED